MQAAQEKDEFSLEEDLQKVEEIINKMKSGQLNLEEMIKLYEEGISLLTRCKQTLEQAELKINQLSATFNQSESEGDNNG
ncbi:MAG TPA: exodeoxyribonuclease VII small subunit [Candidatus Syntrophosphaera sp.]|jgi:exodeoxyribonuclease VII small subunit|nr:exodeoxyribonuclease VII small subunit [Candidatus Syntrophosphaera sp.]HNU97647.1 exodeoxyribonuclease VII small subunit [Candidatus Syntrophosphaera thermopropionivorans]MBP7932847.1 exodeoxyribonuclease VII small subunit [Candidatus Syntrophosphaera sp.]MBP9006970.1 exodeoxyribonuclease VII small subunit [Candidatus Syntrophosphaera sp.]HOH82931.1 exodeoxyribonuclease VII small subunit [Candidatus Syntrophosphaera thermopropionivorans]